MPEFAHFSTPRVRLPRLAGIGLVVRAAAFDDLDTVAELAAWREGVDVARQREGLERSFGKPDTTLTVATFEGRLAGFGRTAYLKRPPDAPPNCIPDGWYLTGVVVHPDMRRRGVGDELTRWRLELLFQRAATAYYFATAINRPTIALHERLGFREIARDIWAPGSTFTGGVGVLFELSREEWARRR